MSQVTEETASEGNPFTTYNFEVADFHTYFAGTGGVWVHNAGNGLCELVFTVYQNITQANNLQDDPWSAFKLLLAKTSNMADRIDAAMPKTTKDVMRRMYQKAIKPDGSVDLSKVPSVQEIYETCYTWDPTAYGKGAWVNARVSRGSYFENHHTTPKEWIKKLFPDRQFSNTELDSMPGILIPRNEHNLTNFGGDELSFHNILNRLLPKDTADQATILERLEEVYTDWDPELGPQIWKTTREWLREEGLQ